MLWYHYDSTFPLLILFLILFTFFFFWYSITQYSLFHLQIIVDYANMKKELKEKNYGRRNENNHHYPSYYCCSYAKSIFCLPSILNPFISIFIHYFYSNIALEATKMHFFIFIMKNFLIIHQMHSHVVFNL